VSFPLELDLALYCSFGCGLPEEKLRREIPKSKKIEPEDDYISQIIMRKPFSTVKTRSGSTSINGLGGGSNYSQGEADILLARRRQDQKEEKSPRQSNSASKQLYHLTSVIVHHGNHLGGHYAVYRKLLTSPLREPSRNEEEQREWVYISDERVRPVSVSEVLKSQAYMLYYEKC